MAERDPPGEAEDGERPCHRGAGAHVGDPHKRLVRGESRGTVATLLGREPDIGPEGLVHGLEDRVLQGEDGQGFVQGGEKQKTIARLPPAFPELRDAGLDVGPRGPGSGD